ncbi:hypothetical protein J1614_009200 [Plenodomus biglobosus]|nr:hypothetical protein J1614_009200 [Plenodomus biglobosus]
MASAPPHAQPSGTGATPVIFVYTGQGSAYGDMGSQLFATASSHLPPFLHLLTDGDCNESA